MNRRFFQLDLSDDGPASEDGDHLQINIKLFKRYKRSAAIILFDFETVDRYAKGVRIKAD